MPAAHAITIRKEIVERRSGGESFRHIARTMGLSYDTVRAIWRHWESRGTLAANYEACRHKGPRKAAAVVEAALGLKRAHPRWGAGLIRVLLSEEFAAQDLPSERTLQRWWRQAGLGRTPSAQQSRPQVIRGKEVHEVWAIDAKEKMTLGDKSGASWLTISDEASGAILLADAFPPTALGRGRPSPSTGVSASDDGLLGETAGDALR
ncbi:MAG: helix-turn-helix domain containing protein [Chloroflexota bacterium]|jgi:transposase